MVVVTVELWPYGNKAAKVDLGQLRIGLHDVAPGNVGTYTVTFLPSTERHAVTPDEAVTITHQRGRGVWSLLRQALNTLLPERVTP